VEVLRGLARKLTWRPGRVRQPRPVPQGWPCAITDPRPGINEAEAGARLPAPTPETWVSHPIDLDIGELADGYHLIVRSISLSANLNVDWVLVPDPPEVADLWPEIRYDADVSPPGWNQWRADFDIFERPVPKARKAWFDFFRPYYEWYAHLDDHGQPDGDYLRNRMARLTFDLRTGEAKIEQPPLPGAASVPGR
jgi:hypothetical protein